MKYLTEYRDGAGGPESWRPRIARTVTRPWTIMEVCGGQTHTIVKYGLDHDPAAGRRAGARAGLPGLRDTTRDDRPGARDRRAARRDLLLVRRHAACARLARRPACSKSRGAATCGSSTHRSMPSISRRPIPIARSSSSRSDSRRRRRPMPWPSRWHESGGLRISACWCRTCWCRR